MFASALQRCPLRIAHRTQFLMAELTCQFVRPDKLLYEGTVEESDSCFIRWKYGVCGQATHQKIVRLAMVL